MMKNKKILIYSCVIILAIIITLSIIYKPFAKDSINATEVNNSIAIVNDDKNLKDENIQILFNNNKYYTYTMTSKKEAQKGLKSNEYIAYVSVPSNFSQVILNMNKTSEEIIQYQLNSNLEEEVNQDLEEYFKSILNLTNQMVNYIQIIALLEEYNNSDIKAEDILRNKEKVQTIGKDLEYYPQSFFVLQQAGFNMDYNLQSARDSLIQTINNKSSLISEEIKDNKQKLKNIEVSALVEKLSNKLQDLTGKNEEEFLNKLKINLDNIITIVNVASYKLGFTDSKREYRAPLYQVYRKLQLVDFALQYMSDYTKEEDNEIENITYKEEENKLSINDDSKQYDIGLMDTQEEIKLLNSNKNIEKQMVNVASLFDIPADSYGNFFISFVPIMIMEEFQYRGGSLTMYYEGDEKDDAKIVDWSNEVIIEQWSEANIISYENYYTNLNLSDDLIEVVEGD